ncbi:MAG: hypothetical protein ACFFAO_00880 [Candidatus Hermodarchaeota archaeon]
MNKLQNRFRLLSLISIYFIYRIIVGYLENDEISMMIWIMITIVYIISLIILYFVARRWQEELDSPV